jgi:DNA-directed RNA polymerase subunit RPC12/RpoP
MSQHRIIVCEHCGKENEDVDTMRWERGCDVCGKRVLEGRMGGCIVGETINQIQLQSGNGTRVTIDACGDCIGNGGATRKLIALVAANVSGSGQ